MFKHSICYNWCVLLTLVLCKLYITQIHIRRGCASAIAAHFHTQTHIPTYTLFFFPLSQARLFWHLPAMMSYCDNTFLLAYLLWLFPLSVKIIFRVLVISFMDSLLSLTLKTCYLVTLCHTVHCLCVRLTAIHCRETVNSVNEPQ